jgi:1-pyrroline-5-carboxylate dehydrogenase
MAIMATVDTSLASPRTRAGIIEVTPYRPEPFTDFSRPDNARAMRDAIDKVRTQLGREYDLIIGGQRRKTEKKIISINPGAPSEVVGIFQQAGAEEVPVAMAAALKAYESWSRTPMEERAQLLLRVARAIKENRFEWNARLVFEVGKNWAEADADTAETIDFANFYAREALRLANAQPAVQMPGEHDTLKYIPLGVGAVISPWNFPFAIMAGMTMAAIVCGNTVVLKPSSDSPAIAAEFVELLEECGMPEGVVNFCTGSGSTFGNGVVEHPKTRFIAFTGSKEVGLAIHERASKTQKGQIWIKRTVLEMGGKDAIVVDADADFDAAVDGVVASAFGFSGQKCSACSRAIVDERIYEKFLERLRARVEKLTVGKAEDNPNMGPVVNKSSYEKIQQYIKKGVADGGRIITGGGVAAEAGEGYFLQPTVIADVKPGDTIEQEEIFGPVLAVIKCRNFEDGLRIANDTEFGLTGAAFTSSEDKITRAMEEFHVGNLYINRKCTGAIVGAHPFGGFNMSGTDSKAGGPDYLLLFTQAKSIARKL